MHAASYSQHHDACLEVPMTNIPSSCPAGRRPARRPAPGEPRSLTGLQHRRQLSGRPALLERRGPGSAGSSRRLGHTHPAPPSAGLHRQAPRPAGAAVPRGVVHPGSGAAASAAAARRAHHRRQPDAAAAQDRIPLCQGRPAPGMLGGVEWQPSMPLTCATVDTLGTAWMCKARLLPWYMLSPTLPHPSPPALTGPCVCVQPAGGSAGRVQLGPWRAGGAPARRLVGTPAAAPAVGQPRTAAGLAAHRSVPRAAGVQGEGLRMQVADAESG